MADDEPVQPTVTSLPIVTATDGQPYIGCDTAIALLRSLAAVAARIDNPEDARDFAAAITIEADALEVRAIAHTTEEPRP